MKTNFTQISSSNTLRSPSSSSINKGNLFSKLTTYTNKGILLAYMVNFKIQQKSNNIEEQNSALEAMEGILNETNSSITFDEVQHCLRSESMLFQHQLPHFFRQAIIELKNDGGSEYEKFLTSLAPSASTYLQENNIPSLTKDILASKLDVWINEAPDEEKPARLAAKSRILDAYDNESESLDLGSLRLTTLSANMFNDLNNLRTLTLSDNQLTTLPVGIFIGLTNLKTLHLSNNQLTTLPDEAFKGLANLDMLYISNNPLSSLSSGVFNGLTKLTELRLTNNQLHTLHEDTFNDLTNLYELYLLNNQLSTLPVGIFNSFIRHVEVYLEGNRFNIEAIHQLRSSCPINIRILISVHEEHFLPNLDNLGIMPSLSIMENLNKILNIAHTNHELQLDWNHLDQHIFFDEFLNKVHLMADTRISATGRDIAFANLAKIIIAMDQNSELREACFNIARESTQTCGDRVTLGFIQMQIQAKLYKPNASLSELFAQQKIMCALEIIFKLAQNKVKNATGVIDEIEVYLTYIKNLKDYLQVEIDNMLYEALSDVTQADINIARTYLDTTLTDNYIYEKLLDSDIIQKRYANEFEDILNKLSFNSTLPSDEEDDKTYTERMEKMANELKQAKISFLEGQLNKAEQIFASLPPLVEAD
jgi:Leucine-rich repeat (LRR) protein